MKKELKISAIKEGTVIDHISPGNALKVFMALGGKLGWENTVVETIRNEIMESTSLSEKTVQSALNELEELKVISRIGPNNRRKYVLSQMYVKKGKSSKSNG